MPVLKFGTSRKFKLDKINEWILKNHSDWKKDENGEFVVEFECLKLDKRMRIRQLTLIEITILIKHLGIEIDSFGKGKEELIKEIVKKTKIKYPGKFNFTNAGDMIIDPELFK